jgi:hypothetical protein
MVAGGLFCPNGVFYVMPKNELTPLAVLFRAEFLNSARRYGRLQVKDDPSQDQ